MKERNGELEDDLHILNWHDDSCSCSYNIDCIQYLGTVQEPDPWLDKSEFED